MVVVVVVVVFVVVVVCGEEETERNRKREREGGRKERATSDTGNSKATSVEFPLCLQHSRRSEADRRKACVVSRGW